MDMILFILIAIIGFVSGVVSGISGGGGAMLMIPAFILSGLPPQVAVATAKLSGIGGDFGGIVAFMKSGRIRKDIIRVMIPIAIIVGLTTPFVFATIENSAFQVAIAIVMVLMVPTLFVKKKAVKPATRSHRLAGYSLYTLVLFLQGIFSGGVGGLAVYVLKLLFGATNIETMATRRVVVAVMSPISVAALYIGGFVHVGLGLIGLVAAFAGTYVGSKFVLKRSESFVSIVMAITIVISSCILIVTA